MRKADKLTIVVCRCHGFSNGTALPNLQSMTSGRILRKTNMKHYKTVCPFELDVASGKAESAVESNFFNISRQFIAKIKCSFDILRCYIRYSCMIQ